jgi:ATP-dependent Lon protease
MVIKTRSQKRKYETEDENTEKKDKKESDKISPKKIKPILIETEEDIDIEDDSDTDENMTSEYDSNSDSDFNSEDWISQDLDEENDQENDNVIDDIVTENQDAIRLINPQNLSNKQIGNIIKTVMKKVKDNDEQVPTEKKVKTEYSKFFDLVDKVYSGDFFMKIPIEDKKKKFKTEFTEEQVIELTLQLKEIEKYNKEQNIPSIIDILKKKVSVEESSSMLEKIHLLANAETLSPEYDYYLKEVLKYQDSTQNLNPEQLDLERDIKAKLNMTGDVSYKSKILSSNMNFHNKCIAFSKLQHLDSVKDNSDSDFIKYKNWLEQLLSINFGIFCKLPIEIDTSTNLEISDYLVNVRGILDRHISFLEQPKDKVINFITQLIRNPNSKLQSIGIKGAPGLGKTSIVKSIAEALNRPYKWISLGGNSHSSYLSGHDHTYIGSHAGRIIECIKESGVMNPVIYLDELDKVSTSDKGLEIIGFLTHLIDYTTNSNFNYDKYFSGIEFDLSKVLFVFTYNDETKIDKIMFDRMYKINVDKYLLSEKVEIAKKHLFSEVLHNFGFKSSDIIFPDDSLKFLIETKTKEDGVRDLKRYLELLVSRINTISMIGTNSTSLIKLDYIKKYPNGLVLPVTIDNQMIEVLCADSSSKNAYPEFMYS